MSRIFPRHTRQPPPVAGAGGHLSDASGKCHLDAPGGAADRVEQHHDVGDLWGRGLSRGIELVADRDTKAPFDAANGVAGRIKKAALADGLICYPMSGPIDGCCGDHILLAPPFVTEDAQPDERIDRRSTAIAAGV